MILLLDINVILDVVLARLPWATEAALLLSAIDAGRAQGHVAGHTIPTIHYLTARARGKQVANAAVSELLRFLHVVPLGDAEFQQALALGLADFEDAVQAAAALRLGADYLVTRNPGDFAGAPVPLAAPGELLARLG